MTIVHPTDIEEAHEQWRANCGPAALAAVLGRSVASVRSVFPTFPERPWTNVRTMKKALEMLNVQHVTRSGRKPRTGLIFVQFHVDGLPVRAQYQHTHWLAIHQNLVSDVNLDQLVTCEQWDCGIGAQLMERHKATRVYIRTGIALRVDGRGFAWQE